MWPLAGWRAWITSFDVRCLPSSASYRLGILFSSALSWRWKILDYSLRPSTMSFQSLMAMPSALISHGLQTFGECYSVHLTQRARLTLALESRKCHCLFVCWKFNYAIPSGGFIKRFRYISQSLASNIWQRQALDKPHKGRKVSCGVL